MSDPQATAGSNPPNLATRLGNWALAAIAPVVVFVAVSPDREYLVDFWHHLAQGRVDVQQGRVITEDQFACTVPPDRHLVNPNWGSQVVYYGLYALGGLDLVFLVNALVLASAMALLVHHCRRRSESARLAAALGLFAFFGLWQFMTVRPQSFAFLLFLLLYTILERSSERRWLLALAPPVLAVWVNLHGSFPMGCALIGLYLLDAAWESWQSGRFDIWRNPRVVALALCLLGSGLALLVNPHGWQIYQYVTSTTTASRARRIQEWLPPGLDGIYGPVFAASILLMLFSLALSPRRPTRRELILLAVFLPPALGAVRMAPWWFFVSLPIVAAQLAVALPRSWLHEDDATQSALVNGMGLGVLLTLAVASVPGVGGAYSLRELLPKRDLDTAKLSVLADELRRAQPEGGCIYSNFEWGEYLSWALAPDGFKIFMDGRMDVYSPEVWNEYLAVTYGSTNWQEILDRRGVTCLVLNTEHSDQSVNLLPRVRDSKRWKQAFEAGNAVLFLKVSPDAASTRGSVSER
ncbi:MAG: hypothetical protein K2R98_09545 [Gemmataceae bacterium]|nr:hypothetical protein [Gemmataceae bacterium]